MIQTVAAYAIVALAAAVLAWRVLMPARLRARLRGKQGDCGDDCGCS